MKKIILFAAIFTLTVGIFTFSAESSHGKHFTHKSIMNQEEPGG